MPWIALAIATAGTSLQLALATPAADPGHRACTFVPERMNVEHLPPRNPSVADDRIHWHPPTRDQKARGDVSRLFDDLERNQTLKRLVRGAMQAEASRPPP